MSIIVVNRETRETLATYRFTSMPVALATRVRILAKWIRQRRQPVLVSSVIRG